MNTTTITSLKGEWAVDSAHSNMQFSVTHLVISHVNGSFEAYDGVIKNEGDDLTSAHVEFSIDPSSINTGNEQRDNHLKSDDFFNAEKYPHIKFESSSIEEVSENTYEIKGDLTIRDITRPTTFKARVGGVAVDGYGNTKLGMRVNTTINRFDYGLKWNQLTEAGGVTVGKDVEINANLQFGKK